MTAALLAKAKQNTASQASAHRDKRYTIPVLSVDLFGKVHETQSWSLTHIILKDYDGPLEAGAEFAGVFAFENQSSFGLFNGRIARRDPKRQLVGIEIISISKEGRQLLEAMNFMRPADAPEKGAVMRVSFNHHTLNWSLTGMLLGQYYGRIGAGKVFKGIIRTEKIQEFGVFTAKAVHEDLERHTLALKFASMSSQTFELLEAAIKKSGFSQNAPLGHRSGFLAAVS